jgi:hypothetical protein
MAGQGILVDDTTSSAGVNIERNAIARCGNSEMIAGLTETQGGIRIYNSAFCRIVDNHVQDCGRTPPDPANEHTERTAGIFLSGIYDLTCTGNQFLGNRGGGRGNVFLQEVLGSATLHGNRIVQVEGIGLFWDGSPMGFEALSGLIALYLSEGGFNTKGQGVRASIQGNTFEMISSESPYGFFLLASLERLSLVGNIGSRLDQGTVAGHAEEIAEGIAIGNAGLNLDIALDVDGSMNVE